jgi:hypothetical protein
MRNTYKILIGKLAGKKILRSPRHGCEDNIRTDLIEIGSECVDWMQLAQDGQKWLAVANTVMNIRVP